MLFSYSATNNMVHHNNFSNAWMAFTINPLFVEMYGFGGLTALTSHHLPPWSGGFMEIKINLCAPAAAACVLRGAHPQLLPLNNWWLINFFPMVVSTVTVPFTHTVDSVHPPTAGRRRRVPQDPGPEELLWNRFNFILIKSPLGAQHWTASRLESLSCQCRRPVVASSMCFPLQIERSWSDAAHRENGRSLFISAGRWKFPVRPACACARKLAWGSDGTGD